MSKIKNIVQVNNNYNYNNNNIVKGNLYVFKYISKLAINVKSIKELADECASMKLTVLLNKFNV